VEDAADAHTGPRGRRGFDMDGMWFHLEGEECRTGQRTGNGVGKYVYFDDVLLPKELSLDEDASYVYETPQFKAGTMVLTKWRLDPKSLLDFFTYYMEKDNWKMVNSFQGKESVLNSQSRIRHAPSESGRNGTGRRW